MKYIQISLGWSDKYLIPCDGQSAALLVALGNAIKVSLTTKDKLSIYKKEESNIELAFVEDPRFDEIKPVENELLTKLQAAESRWLEYYQKAQEADKRTKLAEEKLAELQKTLGQAIESKPKATEDVPF